MHPTAKSCCSYSVHTLSTTLHIDAQFETNLGCACITHRCCTLQDSCFLSIDILLHHSCFAHNTVSALQAYSSGEGNRSGADIQTAGRHRPTWSSESPSARWSSSSPSASWTAPQTDATGQERSFSQAGSTQVGESSPLVCCTRLRTTRPVCKTCDFWASRQQQPC